MVISASWTVDASEMVVRQNATCLLARQDVISVPDRWSVMLAAAIGPARISVKKDAWKSRNIILWAWVTFPGRAGSAPMMLIVD
jgi:hypothetical protein